ncbi:hypothetical protein L211DRAFT_901742 [Terfezia boudieri ATCC MYA-4762]|uniref:Uncharacterized protein n=1 Tax=Terfezia boudieri ATCC MYA-4762 TaxID=1051890 RepID=A0A3N4L6Y6_9PEZI|nr:hypothetical protein L211DRAFT_901742 [Terfezia boudieri ATCC MYA-4762]
MMKISGTCRFCAPSSRPRKIADLGRHCEYVTACITNKAPPQLPVRYIDHQYFYVKDGIGMYACGIARQAAARKLRKHKMTAFANQKSLTALRTYIHNPSVTGFFIEHAVLSSIVAHGLNIMGIHSHVRQKMFNDVYPTFDTSLESWVLYCPLRYNCPAVDAILVQFVNTPQDNSPKGNSRKNTRRKKNNSKGNNSGENGENSENDENNSSGKKKKCVMYPIQVTVAKSHADSAEAFFKGNWARDLSDYDIDVEFCWITPDQELRLKDVSG